MTLDPDRRSGQSGPPEAVSRLTGRPAPEGRRSEPVLTGPASPGDDSSPPDAASPDAASPATPTRPLPPADWSPPAEGRPPTGPGAPAGQTGWTPPSGGTDGASAPAPPGRSAAPRRSPRAAAAPAIPLRPLDVGDILDGTFGTIRRNPGATLGLSAVLVTVQQLVLVGIEVATRNVPTASGTLSSQVSLQLVGGIGLVAEWLLSAVIGAVITSMIAVVVAEDVLGRSAGIGEVWRRVRPLLPALLAAAALSGLLPFVGLVLLIVPGVLLWGIWALTMPALVLERLGPLRALRRSWRLARPDIWRVWGVRALSVVLGAVIQNVIALPVELLGAVLAVALGERNGNGQPTLTLIFAVIGAIAGGTIASPFRAGVLALLYLDRRMRAEGLDIVLQQRRRTAERHARFAGSAGGTRFAGSAGGTRFAGSAGGTRFTGSAGGTRFTGSADGTRFTGSADGTRFTGSADGSRLPGDHPDLAGIGGAADPPAPGATT